MAMRSIGICAKHVVLVGMVLILHLNRHMANAKMREAVFDLADDRLTVGDSLRSIQGDMAREGVSSARDGPRVNVVDIVHTGTERMAPTTRSKSTSRGVPSIRMTTVC